MASRVIRGARALLDWCEDHPIPGTIALFFAMMIALFTFGQGVDWATAKIWPPTPRIIHAEMQSGSGGNFSVTIENPRDISMIVTDAVFRAEPPRPENANAIELMIPAVTYDVPFDCSPGTKRVKLNPPFKVTGKDVGAVVFRSIIPMHDCDLYVSLETSQGRTKEQEGVSLAGWRTRAP